MRAVEASKRHQTIKILVIAVVMRWGFDAPPSGCRMSPPLPSPNFDVFAQLKEGHNWRITTHLKPIRYARMSSSTNSPLPAAPAVVSAAAAAPPPPAVPASPIAAPASIIPPAASAPAAAGAAAPGSAQPAPPAVDPHLKPSSTFQQTFNVQNVSNGLFHRAPW